MKVSLVFNGKRMAAGTSLGIMVAAACLVLTRLGPRDSAMRPAPPPFAFRTVHGPTIFQVNPSGHTLVVLFHSLCGHCTNEFDELESHLDQLGDTRLYLLTTEESFDKRMVGQRWPRLAQSDQVIWGTIERDQRDRYFGVATTPALFLYDHAGIGLGNWRGETKFAVLLDAARADLGFACVRPDGRSHDRAASDRSGSIRDGCLPA
jgi:hypothetical protein